MALPPFLLKEVRSTFQFCARQHVATRRCPLSCSATSLKSRTKPSSSSNTTVPAVPSSSKSLSDPNSVQDDSPSSRQGSQGPVRQQDDGKALERARKAEVPMKVLPRAELSSKHKLSPMQRLHIEHLTRHPPKQPPTKVFKERLLIYHCGFGRVRAMIFSRVSAIVALCFVTAIWVPAYSDYGTPLFYIGLVWLGSFVPIFFISWATRPIATEIWLRLPFKARQSPQAAMHYAKNLPRDASIDVSFMRWTSHTSSVPINVVDTTPVSSRWKIKPVSFKWVGPRVDTGTSFRPNPTEFFVRPISTTGKASRNTIPGLWSAVYKRLTGLDSNAVTKWRS